MRTKLFAMVGGFILGGLLDFWWKQAAIDSASGPWWHLTAMALTGLGIAWFFSDAWLTAALSTGVAPFLLRIVQIFLGAIDLHFREGIRNPFSDAVWPIVLLGDLVFGLPAPFIGGVIGHLLSRMGLSRRLCLIPLIGSFGICISMCLIQQAELRGIETKEIPTVMQQVYEADISYSTRQPDKAFTCDLHQLPQLAKLDWVYQPYLSIIVVQNYTMHLECPHEVRPQSFCLWAHSHEPTQPGPTFWIDQRGKLVKGESGAYRGEESNAIRGKMCPVQ